jgi:hypothetical protein
MSRLAIRSMAKIACSGQGGPGAAEAISRRLLDLLDLNVDHVSSEAASALTLMVRKHPSLKALVAPPLARSLKYVTETTGRASVLHLLGDCGELVPEAPYVLEKMIDGYDDIKDTNIKMALLTSTMKLFLQKNRAPETQRMLGRLLFKATDDVSSQDLHDQALLYYRLLRTANPQILQAAAQSIKPNMIPEDVPFAEDNDKALKALLMEEFNTLSILYGKPAVHFIAPEHQVKYVKMPSEHPLDPNAAPVPAADLVTAPAPGAAAADTLAAEVDLLGFGGPPAPAPAPEAPASTSATLSLDPNMSLSGEDYQSQWEAISDADSHVATVVFGATKPLSTDIVESALASMHVRTMASGELPTEFKFFLYAADSESGALFLIQGNIDKQAGEPLMIITVKVAGGGSNEADLVAQLSQNMTNVFQ